MSLEKETKKIIYEDSNPGDNHQQRKNISSLNETNISENINNNDSLETNPNMTITNDEKEIQKLSKELEEFKIT